jgi:hypothetical protein
MLKIAIDENLSLIPLPPSTKASLLNKLANVLKNIMAGKSGVGSRE